jgi:hypothetical protein
MVSTPRSNKRPMAIISTEGMSKEEMKAAAAQAVSKYQKAEAKAKKTKST